MAEFTWAESPGAQLSAEPRLATTRFGDGYEQAAPDGLNPQPEMWSLSFRDCNDVSADAIIAFFKARNGLAFDWRPPRTTVPRRFVCRRWSRTWNDVGSWDIEATFEERFGV